jgi:Recombination endonuclease VII
MIDTYTGRPCKTCGGVLRYSSNCNCVACGRSRKFSSTKEVRLRYERSVNGKAARRKFWLKKKYGITEAEHQQMLRNQNSLCAICKREVKLCVDHNHKTGKVRGLLCNSCNLIVGVLQDNPTIIRNMITYLETS